MFNFLNSKQKEQSRIAQVEAINQLHTLKSTVINLQFELSKLNLNISQTNLILFYVCHIAASMEKLNITKLDFNADKCQTLVCSNGVLSIKKESEEI